MKAFEVNFDGLVGPTHSYAGLSYGNVASINHARGVSSPRAAARQGLDKMMQLAGMGIKQALLPPQERPAVYVLRRLGFAGSDAEVITRASRKAPRIFQACCSASSMWTANAATVSPSADCADGRVHFTPANLSSKFHRAIEPPTTARILRAIFADERYFVHHPPLPAGEHFADEGAANHTRLCRDHGDAGVELFVFGRRAFGDGPRTARFPARQTFEASAAVARLHRLDPSRVMFAQQHPAAIDAGVFHNDVIAVGNANVLFFHSRAFLGPERVLGELCKKLGEWCPIEIGDDQVTVEEAVGSYLFNSQLLTLPDGSMALVAPGECRENARVKACLDAVLAGPNLITEVHYLDVRESMRNGGGPACLRLRVVLTEAELAQVNPAVFLNHILYQELLAWVDRHYRDRLTVADLADPALLTECRTALDELTGILELGSIYPFQGY